MKSKTLELKNLGEIIRGRMIPSKELKKKGNLLYLTGRNIQNGSLVIDKNSRYFNKEINFDKNNNDRGNRFILQDGDIIISALWKDRKIYQYKDSDPPSICSGNQFIIRSNKNDYLMKYFSVPELRKNFNSQCQNKLRGTVIPFLSTKDFSQLKIQNLSKKEILNKLDKAKDELLDKSAIIKTIDGKIKNEVQNKFIKGLVEEYFLHPVLKLAKQDESLFLEFKSTLKKDLDHGGEVEEDIIINSVIKTIAGFCNTGGGDLLIGVTDHNKIIGIEEDNFKSNDEFYRNLITQIENRTMPNLNNVVGVLDITLNTFNDKTICKVSVEPSDVNVIVKFKGKELFYKRNGSNTQPLSRKEMIDYIKDRDKKLV